MKNLFRSAALLAVVVALSACWPAQTYDNHGLSFDYPSGWKVTVDEFANSQGYLSLEKDGSTPTASIVFGWLISEARIGSDMMLHGIIEQMKTDDGLTDVVTESAVDTTYGEYQARSVTYTAKINGIPVSGAVWVFTAEGRVMNVAVREGIGNANVGDFKKIKDSFTLK